MELILAEAMARAIAMGYLQTAWVKHPKMHSAYEGAAILKKKYDTLWEEVRRLDAERMRGAAVKLAASALRFVVEICPPTETADNGRRSALVRRWIRDARRKSWPSSAGKGACPRRVAATRRLANLVASRDMDTPAKPPWAVVPDL
jgi:hypothetical protein